MHSLRIRHLEKVKAEIKAELSAFEDAAEKQSQIARSLDDAQEKSTPIERLKIVVYVISSLLTNVGKKTLTNRQVSNLVDLARSSLFVLQISPGKSKLSQLYGELQFAIGLNKWRDGSHWSATWEQELGFDLAQVNMPGGEDYHQYVRGIRLARLGYAQVAITSLEKSLIKSVDTQRFKMTKIHIAKAHRMAGNFAGAEKALIDLDHFCAEDQRLAQEVKWERLCRQCVEDGNAKAVYRATRQEKTHENPIYLIEAFLWAFALNDSYSLRKLYKMSYLARGRVFKISDYGLYFRTARLVEQSLDPDYPLTTRIEFASTVMESLHQISSLDLEMLFRTCMIRSLSELGCHSLEELARLQFDDIGRRLSNGRSTDPQGLLTPSGRGNAQIERGA